MKKYMKSTLKTVVVKCLDWTETIKVDSEIFDDCYMEAATQAIEKRKHLGDIEIAVVMECYEKKDVKRPDKHYVYNTYFVLLNVGMYDKAEMLRLNFLKLHKVDLEKESLKGEAGDDIGGLDGGNETNN